MMESKIITIRVTRNLVTTLIKDSQVNYWVERSWYGHQKTYYEFRNLIIPSWSKHLQKDLENWIAYNIEDVDNLYYGQTLEIKL
jgi:hypothetical protein